MHAHRASSLMSEIDCTAHIDIFNHHFPDSTPEMRSLTLCGHGASERRKLVIPGIETSPQLQFLTLLHVGVEWATLQACNLATLLVWYPFPRPSWTSMRHVLLAMKCLQVVSLRNAMSYSWDGDDDPPIVLPKLWLLDLWHDFATSNNLLTRLELPRGVHITINDSIWGSLRAFKNLITRSLRHHLFKPSHSPMKEVAIRLTDDHVTVLAWGDAPAKGRPIIEIQFKAKHSNEIPEAIMSTVGSSIVAGAYVLRLHSSRRRSGLEPPSLGVHLALRALYLSGPSAQRLLHCLSPATCPHLNTVDISHGSLNQTDLEQLQILSHDWKVGGVRLSDLYLQEGREIPQEEAENVIYVMPESEAALDLARKYADVLTVVKEMMESKHDMLRHPESYANDMYAKVV
jgi:hypothetical protein